MEYAVPIGNEFPNTGGILERHEKASASTQTSELNTCLEGLYLLLLSAVGAQGLASTLHQRDREEGRMQPFGTEKTRECRVGRGMQTEQVAAGQLELHIGLLIPGLLAWLKLSAVYSLFFFFILTLWPLRGAAKAGPAAADTGQT